MLVDEGFKVVSVDASDKMLKHALKARWEKRKDPRYDEWGAYGDHRAQSKCMGRIDKAHLIIEEANWETLYDDVQHFQPGAQFDAVLCLGNSFAHLLDEFGDQREQLEALRNFALCLKPGGLLIIDHRNYDSIIDSGATPGKSIYYNCNQKRARSELYTMAIKSFLQLPKGTIDFALQFKSLRKTSGWVKADLVLGNESDELDLNT
ncbi:Glycine N-methyltransferase [Eumeta japonica]|uniref:Glycine N-methyltransferase n=1 Tax=Eumeta variegata TaxID=151549 RepID=A0A4C1SMK7_EUMVA|nr:Glycine N-methyltransferase [Eumeta japonica]